ncbi:MAG: M23 family metallopeptidase [Candidatus Dojkabacteria bacterium]
MKKLIRIVVLLFIVININGIHLNAYSWPSDGYVGYRFGDTISYSSPHTDANGTYYPNFHNGIDIWSTQNGGWINGQVNNSNPIYAVTNGTVNWIGGSGLIIKNDDGLYSNYWHVKNLAVSTSTRVDSNTLLGYQNYDVAVHVHITISTTASDSGHVDSTPYFNTNGYELDVRKQNAMPAGTYVSRESSCAGSNIILSNLNIGNGNSYNCSASQTISLLPNSTFLSGSNVRLSIN